MKSLLFAAAVTIAVPAFAQTGTTTGYPPTGTTPGTGSMSTPTSPMAPGPMSPDGRNTVPSSNGGMYDTTRPQTSSPASTTRRPNTSMPNTQMQNRPMQNGQMPRSGMQGTQPMNGMGTNQTIGVYQPTQPPINGTLQPGMQPVYRQAAPVSQAYPAPAPRAEYPICQRGQYDGCRQRGG